MATSTGSGDRVVRVRSTGADELVSEVRTVDAGSQQDLAAPLADVRAALPAVHDSLGLPTSWLDPGRTAMGSRSFSVRRLAGSPLSRWLECGRTPTGRDRADAYDVTLSVVTSLAVRDSASTTVTTRLSGRATPRSVSGGDVACGSTGRLELRILEALAARVPG